MKHLRVGTWNPDGGHTDRSGLANVLKRRDIWFYGFIIFLMLLLVMIWQQNKALRLATDVAVLEAESGALEARLMDLGSRVTRLRQPSVLVASGKLKPDLSGRVFVTAPALPGQADVQSSGLLALLDLKVPAALAAETP